MAGTEEDVDDMLERAFQRVEEGGDIKKSAGNTAPMDESSHDEPKKVGIKSPIKAENTQQHNNGKQQSGSGDDDDRGRGSRKRRRRHSRSGSSSGSDRRESRRRRSSRSPSEHRRRRSRSRSGDRRRRRSRSRSRSHDRRDKERHHRSRDRHSSSRRRSRSREHPPPRYIDHRRSPPPWRKGDRSPPQQRRLPGPERRDVMPFTPRNPPPKDARMDMTPEERDERTIFILQLQRNTRPRDLEEFFSSVGHVRDVRIITDSKTRRSKGIAYVEFWDREGVPLAMGLNGQKLLGSPLVIQMTCAEKNRLAAMQSNAQTIGFSLTNTTGPMKLLVSNLHPQITDDMITAIFEPFGRVDCCEIEKDAVGQSKGYGYVRFRHGDEGKRAMEQLNGFELAGKNLSLSIVDDEDATPNSSSAQQSQRQQNIPSVDQKSELEDNMSAASQQAEGIPSIATQCFMLSNMFDPKQETEPGWDLDVRDDVVEECNNNGGVVHIYVDKASEQGNVYVKCPTVAAAYRSVVALHGRWFAGKVITANYVPVNSYHDLFPESRSAQTPLQPRPR